MHLKDICLPGVWRSRKALKIGFLAVFLIGLISICFWTGIDTITSKLEGTQLVIWGLRANGHDDKTEQSISQGTPDAIEDAREQYYRLLDQSLEKMNLMPLGHYHSEVPSLYSGPRGILKQINNAKSTHINAYLGKREKDDEDVCGQLRFSKSNEKEDLDIKYSEAKQLGSEVNTDALLRYLNVSGYGTKVPKINMSKMENDRWYRFSGSAIWLEDQQCYFEVDRVMYAPKSRSVPWLSLIWMQLFDKNFNEIKNKRLRFMDLSSEEIEKVLLELRKEDVNKDEEKRERVLDKISIKFPTVMDISFTTEDFGRPQGPEDPRIFARLDDEGKTEPVVIFNQVNDLNHRAMFAGFPLRRKSSNAEHSVPTIQFNFRPETKLKLKSIEKNWMPFVEKAADSNIVSFIYELDPLSILQCTLDDGLCVMVQKAEDKGTRMGAQVSLRGGTNFIPIPEIVMNEIFTKEEMAKYNIKIWISFIKYHGWKSGCGTSTYRPALSALIKTNDNYRIGMMSGAFDFGIDVLSFDGKSVKCDAGGPNVLTPNSIPFWKVMKLNKNKDGEKSKGDKNEGKSKDKKDGEKSNDTKETNEVVDEPKDSSMPSYRDLMGLTISEADRNVKILFINNLVNYLASSFKKSFRDNLQGFGDNSAQEMVDIEKCAAYDFLQYCKNYEKAH
ncbi:hypothetical protein BRETT_004121 [Brettanomyces bruxellensis]|uniref:Uncharacterized protein n=1 Tax=Dekkera bruxellensis TaxID=5007 RepID=A0A871R9V2_DEKBR|nr:uncharacterized protein BRETT_004121 [Brettanomyces bruxellensis]QOU18900.1 hypothetical protein BRETT_004121 [Brettanomyces bruxellensis]